MEEIFISQNDDLVMRLLHYFITEMEYSPIVLHGAKDEIWLEKMDSNYQIIRIVSGYIHNNEQLDFDIFKTRQITKKIKKKTFSFDMNVLSIFVNLGDNVEINKYTHLNKIDCIDLKNIKDVNKYEFIMNEFPTILNETKYKENGLELFMKISGDIAKKNEKENQKAEEVFKERTPYITYLIILINVLIFILGNININIIDSLYLSKELNNEYYRIITAAFTHYDSMHILFNMYSLYIIGPQIENFFGKTKYVLIYLFSAITASLLSLTFMADGGGSLGASGAIFGLFGALLIFGYHYRIYLGNTLKSQIIPIILFNLCLGFMLKGVDNAAHIGGLIGGTFISMGLGLKYKSDIQEKTNGIILSILILGFLIYTAFMR